MISLKKKTDKRSELSSIEVGSTRGPAIFGKIGVVDDVGRHHVDRALDAVELAAESSRSRPQEGCFSYPHIALEQHVPAGENGNRQEADGRRLANDRLLDLSFERERSLAPFGEDLVCVSLVSQLTLAEEEVRGHDLGNGTTR